MLLVFYAVNILQKSERWFLGLDYRLDLILLGILLNLTLIPASLFLDNQLVYISQAFIVDHRIK